MNSASLTLDAQIVQNPGKAIIEKLLDLWIAECEDYRRRERIEILERDPSPATLEQFKIMVKLLLRSAKQLHGLATDPDYPAPQYAEEIAWRLRLLEFSWERLTNPMTDAEAEVLLRQYFPDDPLVDKLYPK